MAGSVPVNEGDAQAGAAKESFIDGFLKSGFSGIAPWILLSVLSGPGRFEIAVLGALVFSLLIIGLGRWRGMPVHSLEIVGVVYFAALAVAGLVAPDNVIRWLDDWAGVLSNVVLALFVLLTIIVRKPFTLSYAKQEAPPEIWNEPGFVRLNDVISAVWGASFAASAAAGATGMLVLRDNDNMWTAWVVPLAATFLAIGFTEVYPDRVVARETGEAAPPLAKVFDWLPGFLLVIGIVGWIADALPDAAAITLIAVGVLGSALLRRILPAEPDAAKATG
jgi:hypothetical protein